MVNYQFPKDEELIENLPKATKNVSIKENTLSIIGLTGNKEEEDLARTLIVSMKGLKKRDWFSQPHIYHCPPVVLGNQVGFLVLLEKSILVRWNGNSSQNDLTITYVDEIPKCQTITSHFGMGIVTIQNFFQIRTPKKVNLMLIHPTNYATNRYICMGAYLETDNLRRDFTFNLKITEPGEYLIEKGSPIGCLIPIPRYYVDEFELAFNEEGLSPLELTQEREAAFLLGRERRERDANYQGSVGRRYLNGSDVWGQKFEDHQKTSLNNKKS